MFIFRSIRWFFLSLVFFSLMLLHVASMSTPLTSLNRTYIALRLSCNVKSQITIRIYIDTHILCSALCSATCMTVASHKSDKIWARCQMVLPRLCVALMQCWPTGFGFCLGVINSIPLMVFCLICYPMWDCDWQQQQPQLQVCDMTDIAIMTRRNWTN